jgi:hypothetical protein
MNNPPVGYPKKIVRIDPETLEEIIEYLDEAGVVQKTYRQPGGRR